MMDKNKIREFLTRSLQDESFMEMLFKLKQDVKKIDFFEKNAVAFFHEVISPEAEKLGYDISEKDWLTFEKSQLSATKKSLIAEDLENVTGGKFSMASLLLGTALFGFAVPAANQMTTGVAFAFDDNGQHASSDDDKGGAKNEGEQANAEAENEPVGEEQNGENKVERAEPGDEEANVTSSASVVVEDEKWNTDSVNVLLQKAYSTGDVELNELRAIIVEQWKTKEIDQVIESEILQQLTPDLNELKQLIEEKEDNTWNTDSAKTLLRKARSTGDVELKDLSTKIEEKWNTKKIDKVIESEILQQLTPDLNELKQRIEDTWNITSINDLIHKAYSTKYVEIAELYNKTLEQWRTKIYPVMNSNLLQQLTPDLNELKRRIEEKEDNTWNRDSLITLLQKAYSTGDVELKKLSTKIADQWDMTKIDKLIEPEILQQFTSDLNELKRRQKEHDEILATGRKTLALLPYVGKNLEAYRLVEKNKYVEYVPDNWDELCKTDVDSAVQIIKKFSFNPQNNQVSRNLPREAYIAAQKVLIIALIDQYPNVVTKLSTFPDLDSQEKHYDEIIQRFTKILSPRQCAQLVYTQVAEIIAYNYEQSDIAENASWLQNHAAKMLENSWGVCRGYAHLTNLLMRILGIPSVFLGSGIHAFNAIYFENEWWLIDTTWASNLSVNEYLKTTSNEKVPADYKQDSRYNVIKKTNNGKASMNYFPKSGQTAEEYNRQFINQTAAHRVCYGNFKVLYGNTVGEMTIQKRRGGPQVLWDISKELIDEKGELRIPQNIMDYIDFLSIKDDEILKQIKKIHIPKHLQLEITLDRRLKHMESVTVAPDNPYYGDSHGLIWDKKSGKVLRIPMDGKISISKDFNGTFTDEVLKRIYEINVAPDNPYYGYSHGLIWNKQSGEKLHIPNYGYSDGLVWNKQSGKVLHIPKDGKISISKDFNGTFTDKDLKAITEIKVAPDNPYYIMYKPKFWGKTGLYYRSSWGIPGTYMLPLARPLWTKPD